MISLTPVQIQGLLYLVPPASRSDRPGELYGDTYERAVGLEVANKLTALGVIDKGIGAVSVPISVISAYEEFLPRTVLMRDTMINNGWAYQNIYSITSLGWEIVLRTVPLGSQFPRPRWADQHDSTWK
jgi:hypothetical protein